MIFSRGVLTDWMLDTMATGLTGTSILVGDGIAPKAGGWSGGQPGEGSFVPYVVLSTGPANKTHREPVGMGYQSTSWSATYTLRHVGSVRQQADWAADKVRRVLSDLKRDDLNLDGTWNLARAEYTVLGAITRNDSTDPPYWELTDSLSLWLEG